MPTGLTLFPILLPAWLLVVARVAALVLAAPVFSSASIPDFFRVALVLAISAMMLPATLPKLASDLTLGQAVAGLGGEIVIGVVLGLAASVVFLAADMAGQLIAQGVGFSLGEIFNPLFDSESTALQQVWFYIALAVFVFAGGAQAIVHILLDSFDQVPPLALFARGAAPPAATLTDFSVAMLDLSFKLALRLAGPTILALMLSTLAMGFLVKTMPQFNVMTVGFSVKVALGLFVMALALPRSGGVMTDAMIEALDALRGVLRELGHHAR